MEEQNILIMADNSHESWLVLIMTTSFQQSRLFFNRELFCSWLTTSSWQTILKMAERLSSLWVVLSPLLTILIMHGWLSSKWEKNLWQTLFIMADYPHHGLLFFLMAEEQSSLSPALFIMADYLFNDIKSIFSIGGSFHNGWIPKKCQKEYFH